MCIPPRGLVCVCVVWSLPLGERGQRVSLPEAGRALGHDIRRSGPAPETAPSLESFSPPVVQLASLRVTVVRDRARIASGAVAAAAATAASWIC